MSKSSIEIQVLSEDYLQETRKVLVNNVYYRNPLLRCLDDTREAYGRRYSSDYMKQFAENGLCVIALSEGRVVGVSLVRTKPHSFPKELQTRLYKVCRAVDAKLHELANLSATLGEQPGDIVRLASGMVLEEYTRRGIYTQMVEKQKELFKLRNIGHVDGMFVSRYAREAALKLGFEMVSSVKYADFEYEGHKPFLSLVEEHEEAALGLLKVA